MKLDLTPEQAFFHGTTRQFLDDKVPTSLVRELADMNRGLDLSVFETTTGRNRC